MTREELQEQAVETSKHHSNIMLIWCTGCGKSKATIDIQRQHNPKNTLVFIAERAHDKNWREEYIKHKSSDLLETTEFECYASMKKHAGRKVDLLVLDEGHHATSELRLELLATIEANKIIVLSATLKSEMIQSLVDTLGPFAISRMPLDKAIKSGILPKPRIYLIPLVLEDTIESEIITESWGEASKRVTIRCELKDRWKYLKDRRKYPAVTLEMKCTQKGKNDYLTYQSEVYKQKYLKTRVEFFKTRWLLLGSQRKRFLGECKSPFVANFLKRIKNKRYVCFCASIDQAEVLGTNTIHSRKRNSQEIIEQFKEGKLSNLFAVGMIQEGANLPSLDVGIIVQLDGQERAFIQKFGRTLRAQDPVQIIFYYPNTRDEEYLEKALEGVDSSYVQQVNSLEEIIV